MALRKEVRNQETRQIIGDYHTFNSYKMEHCIIPVFKRVINADKDGNKTVTSVPTGEERDVMHYWVNVETYASEFDFNDGAQKADCKSYQINLPFKPEGYSMAEIQQALIEQIEEFAGAEIIS